MEESLGRGSRLVDIVDIAVGWVIECIEVEHIEEVGGRVIILEKVSGKSQLGEGTGQKKCGEMHFE